MSTKSELRQEFLQKRLGVSSSEGKVLSLQVQKHLLGQLEQEDPFYPTVGLYSPIRGEVETSFLFHSFRQKGSHAFYPKVDLGKKALHFLEVESLSSLQEGAYGIPEPISGKEAEGLSLLIVPGLAFDESGFRLGYGEGYYDRFLSTFLGFKVGIAFNFQMCARLPREKQDIPCDLVITENRILRKERTLC
ncbi:MAG: 5-formyltetrahydrofolate cyclo-ligase [bacterium]|nr:5-formyltetrahydrofolate cyclo-ligase [bacterium]